MHKSLKKFYSGKINRLKTYKTIINNFFSLSTLEIINYIIPIATLPYLVRVLGPTKYGIVIFAQALVTYFVIAADYGYYLGAPRKVAINRDNTENLSRIFTSIMSIKFLFMTIYSIVFLVIICSVKKFASEALVYLFSFGNILGDFLFPTWFFQGIEKMNFITIFYFIAKSFFLIMIFLFVKSPADYFYVPLFNNLGIIIAGILALYFIRKNYKIKLLKLNITMLRKEIKDEFPYFLTTLSTNAYTNSAPFILGLFAESSFVGYYSAAERLIRAVQRLLWAGSQSVYPHINRIISQSRAVGLRFIRKFFVIFSGSFLLISIIIFLAANLIILTFLGNQYGESIMVLKILSILPFVISISNILGIQTMIPLGLIKIYSRIVFMAMVFNILLSILLARQYQHIGVSIAVVLTEIFLVIAILILLKLKNMDRQILFGGKD
ncbi:MAG: flippase [candidate division WOR-3 bacterium]